MSIRTLLIVLVLAAVATFAAINWAAFMTPTTLSLVFASVQAPLGMVMLGVSGALAAVFLLYVAYLQSAAALETRRFARELEAQRRLADEAERSRVTELRAFLDQRLARIDEAIAAAQTAAHGRMDDVRLDVRAAVEQATTTLSAYIGEVEDRLERGLAAAPPPSR